MTSTLVNTEIEEELQAAAERHSCELLHLDFKGGRLRLVLDRPEGVTIDDCEQVARDASALLDGLDFGSGRYTLEVSSPGLDRELYGVADYERFAGSRVRITWRDPHSSTKRTDVGLLIGLRGEDQGASTIDLEVGATTHNIRLQDVVTARLDPEF